VKKLDEQMRILIVSPKFHQSVASGSAKVAYDVAKELGKKGHLITVYTSDMKDPFNRTKNCERERIKGVIVHYFRSVGTFAIKKMKIFITPMIAFRIRNEIQNFDVIHLHEYRSFLNIIVAYYAKKYNVPYILQAHGSLPRIMGNHMLKWIYDVLFGRRLLRDASRVIALSKVEAEQYKTMGVPDAKINVIPNGIDLSEYNDLPSKGSFKKKYGLEEDKKIVLYLGRINRIKGVDTLVRAFEEISKKLDFVKLVIVGPDDGYLYEITALIKALGMESNVLVTGPLYGNDKLKAYVDASVYVLPSRYETCPLTAIESLACGTPIILTENCGIAQYFGDKIAIFAKPNPKHLSEILFQILQREDIQTSANDCKSVTREFDISKVILQLEKVYKEAFLFCC
jgi:glycosyltransferase involved in cell wall biosynthesis